MKRSNNNMMVCAKCLMGIECHEGTQATMKHYIDIDDESVDGRCDWCEETGNEVLYELL